MEFILNNLFSSRREIQYEIRRKVINLFYLSESKIRLKKNETNLSILSKYVFNNELLDDLIEVKIKFSKYIKSSYYSSVKNCIVVSEKDLESFNKALIDFVYCSLCEKISKEKVASFAKIESEDIYELSKRIVDAIN